MLCQRWVIEDSFHCRQSYVVGLGAIDVETGPGVGVAAGIVYQYSAMQGRNDATMTYKTNMYLILAMPHQLEGQAASGVAVVVAAAVDLGDTLVLVLELRVVLVLIVGLVLFETAATAAARDTVVLGFDNVLKVVLLETVPRLDVRMVVELNVEEMPVLVVEAV